MEEAFDRGKADFSDIGTSSTQERTFISVVLQKTFLDINELETKAAAATYIEEVMAIEPPALKREVFHADRPFLYFIRNGRRGSFLFIGRMTGIAG